MPAEKPAYRYVGDGDQHHSGIPARDLMEADVAGLADELRATLDASPLYKPAGERKTNAELAAAPPAPAKAEPRAEPAPARGKGGE